MTQTKFSPTLVNTVKGEPNTSVSPAYLFSFGYKGNSDGKFNGSSGITVVNDQMYVLDQYNNRIEIFDLQGNYISQFGNYGTGNGQFNGPIGITSNGTNLFITDYGNQRVEVFDLQGNYRSQFASGHPYGIATNGTNIFVVDNNFDQINVYNINGKYLTYFGSYGLGPTNLFYPRDIIVVNSKAYVTDISDFIKIFDLTGNNPTKWFGNYGAGNGQFNGTGGLATDGKNIVVGDINGKRFEAFDLSGKYLSETSWVDFQNIKGIAMKDSKIYVTDFTNDEVMVFQKNYPAQDLTASAGANEITLTWDSPQNKASIPVFSYRIYRSNDTKHFEYLTEVSDSYYNDFAVKGGVTYSYFVTAVTYTGESQQSNVISSSISNSAKTQTITVDHTTTQTTTKNWRSPYPFMFSLSSFIALVLLKRNHFKLH